jgi:uncharacterized membrane-anchored protein YhcB (DUF1043 family)
MDTVTPIVTTATAWSLTAAQGIMLFIGGIVLGVFIYALWSRKRDANSPNSLAAEKKLQAYRQTVHQHLMQTTEQVQQLGMDYQRLVEHMQHIIHELDTSTPEGHRVVPHFPPAHHKPQDEKLDVMPKTYVDRKK